MSNQLKALKAFAADTDLLRLENLLKRFNLFEAIGVKRQELRHSDLLKCLLDSGQNHGLGTIFLTELLRAAVPSANISNLHHTQAEREWNNVDILVVDNANRLAVIIENKIDTTEHSGQLSRYYADVRSHFPEHEIISLYLTPDGDAPSDDRYFAVSYSQICQAIEKIISERHETLDIDVVVVLKHYAQMLRRHIVSDSDVAVLCRSIYQKHRKALDTIFEHRPDQQAQVGEYAKRLIEQTPTLDLGAFGKGWIVFVPSEWNGPRAVTPQPPHLYFQFHNLPHELNILCTLSPGNMEKRTRVFEMAQRHRFVGCPPQLKRGHCNLFSFPVLHTDDYDRTQEEIEVIISEKWAAFLRDDLPPMAQAVREEEWLWELPV